MSSYPTNPVLGPDHKPTPGQTRGQDGNLEWFDSHTNTWSKYKLAYISLIELANVWKDPPFVNIRSGIGSSGNQGN